MAKVFGTWLRDYEGENRQLQRLSTLWTARLRNDYVPATAYCSPEEVWDSLRLRQGADPRLERLVHLAYEVKAGRLRATKSRFTTTAPGYRPASDVPSWPPIWE